MNPIINGLSNTKTNGEITKMSSSEPNSKISLDEPEKEIRKKINKVYCLDGDIIDNTILRLIKNLVFKILERSNSKFTINRPEKYGGKIEFDDYSHLEKTFEEKRLSSPDLKLGFANFLISFLVKPINRMMDEDMIKLKKECGY